jgi:hypothetical protein
MIPFGLAALFRGRGTPAAGRVRILIAAALVVAAIAIAFLPLIWVAIGLVLAASRVSIRAGSPESGLSGQSPAIGRVPDSSSEGAPPSPQSI